VKANDFVAFMLRSPLHGLLGNTMLITVSGRRSGKPITTPVNYARCGDTLGVVSSRTRQWWRNIAPGSGVKIHLDGRDIRGTAEVIADEAAVATQLGEYLRQLPAAAKPLGVRVIDGIPNRQDTARAARSRLLVRVEIDETAA